MSVFQSFIRARLEKIDRRWAQEWDDVFRSRQVATILRRVKEMGADPDFCLYVIAEYRWRTLHPLKPAWQRERLLGAVTTLRNASGEWKEGLQRAARGLEQQPVQEFLLRAERLLRLKKGRNQGLLRAVTRVRKATDSERQILYRAAHGLGLRQVERFLGDFEMLLRSITARDEGAFSVTTTDHPPRGSGWVSARQSTCLSLLDRHMKHATSRNRTARKILAELMGQFRFLQGEGPKDPEGWVEKRLERLKQKRKWPLSISYSWYHSLHEEAKTPCTRACELRLASAHETGDSENENRLYLGHLPRFVRARVRKSSKRGSRVGAKTRKDSRRIGKLYRRDGHRS